MYLSESFEIVAASELVVTQNQMLNTITTARKNAKTIKDSFTGVEARYYSLLTSDEEMMTPVVQSPSISIKYVVVGIVVMAFLYVFYIFITYILNAKIRSTDDMAGVFGVPQSGIVMKSLDKKRLLGKVDEWIYGLQNRNKRIFSEEEAIGLIVSAIKMAAKKQ